MKRHIHKQLQELVFGPCESPRSWKIADDPILAIWDHLRSSNPGALARPKIQFLTLFVNLLFLIACLLPFPVFAQYYYDDGRHWEWNRVHYDQPTFYGAADECLDPAHEWCNRVDLSGAYTPRSPRDLYNPIKEGTLNYFHKFSPYCTVMTGVTGFNRNEGKGVIGTVAMWKDWTPWLYTYTAIAKGSNVDYLPRFRIDHDTNFKLGCNLNWVVPIGIMYFKYFDEHSETALSTGLTYYYKRWVMAYRIFWNNNNPGRHEAVSHKLNVIYGAEGWQWTSLDFTWGKQAFLATYVAIPQNVRRKSFGVTLNHRYWVGCDWGLFGEIGYVWIESPYILYRGMLGLFKEF